MRESIQTKWRMFWAYMLGCIGVLVLAAGGATVNLQAYITFSLLTSNGSAPLADGSLVYIVGSKDGIIDPMQTWGGTNFIGDSVSGDDLIVGVTTIYSADLNSNGTFYAGEFYYDDSLVDYLYIRFFDAPGPVATGMVNWGVSQPPTNVGDLSDCCGLGTLEVDFIGNFRATNYNNFVVIPEPGTANLLVMCGSLFAALRGYTRGVGRGRREKALPEGTGAKNDG
jgi:hypothetical protein